jgi:hypothetical protein
MSSDQTLSSAAPPGGMIEPAINASATSTPVATRACPARMKRTSVAADGTTRRSTAVLGPRLSTSRPRSGAASSPPVVEAANTRLASANEPVARWANSTNDTGAIVPAIPSVSEDAASRGT